MTDLGSTTPSTRLPFIERVIESMHHAPASRLRCAWIIALTIAVIGVADYFADVSVSLIFFYMIPISLAVVWGNKTLGVIVCLVCIGVRTGGDLLNGGYYFPMQTVIWNRIFNFANYLFVIFAVDAVASIHHRLEQKVAQRTQELERVIQSRNQLQAQLIEVGARERAAIGHELHDELCQHLAAAIIAMELLARDLRRTKHSGEEIATAVHDILRKSIAQTKEIAYNLLSAEVHPDKLVSSLHEMSERLGRKSGQAISFQHQIDAPLPDTETSSHLFYIAQEATLNAVKHARAEQIGIKLNIKTDRLTLAVTDNGAGLAKASESEHSMGLKIMTHRANLIGGTLKIESRPEGGTTIVCDVAQAVS